MVTTGSAPTNLFSVPDLAEELGTHDVFLYPIHSPAVAKELMETAWALVEPRGRGIYATDEAPDVVHGMFVQASVSAGAKGEVRSKEGEDETARRRRWREFSCSSVQSEEISGIILHPETVFDFHLAAYVAERGIIPGIRANGELTPLPGSPNEFMVQGLDGLLPRLQGARAAGCRFSKWRVPIACTGGGLPTETGLEMQAETLARFAAVSQEAGLVPIVEPDVEFSGDADLSRSVEVHSRAIELIYERCRKYNVLLEGTLLKSSYAQPGLMHPSRANTKPSEIALAIDTMISRSVPTAVPGVVFLSGGLSPSTATAYLCAVNELANKSPVFSRLPQLSFSYGTVLQGEALKHWVTGDEQGAKAAFEKQSKAYFHAAKGIVY
ncbi:fructose-bisphosphate aldolase [Amanita rubescens]|nr:fructose-bisphosphate aldolase [Amanita rubescens]